MITPGPIFIDAVEPKKPARVEAPDDPRFPDTIEVSYKITPHFKKDHGAQHDDPEELEITLPITTPPAQVPKIASAGIALSPYKRNDKYSATDPRRRFLWIELAEPVKDPQDTYFARMLAYAPDQLISDNRPELLVAREEPPLPVDPEPIRVVIDGATNDLAGLTAMQPMEKATDSDLHYLLPLPPGLHANADEMFGLLHLRVPARSLHGFARRAGGKAHGLDDGAGTLRPQVARHRHPASRANAHLHGGSRRKQTLGQRALTRWPCSMAAT